MSRIVTTDSAGKQRAQLMKGVSLAVRELSQQTAFGDEARDQAAFIALALRAISEGIDSSVAAWEKRGYWVKADRFRMEWGWAGQLASKMRTAVRAGDESGVAAVAAQVAARVGKVQLGPRHRLGKPWIGAFGRLPAE
jgi:hypothetical protein